MATEKTPRVSIILPTYNRVTLLKRAIRSIISQSLGEWELIVINDASLDATKTYLDEIAKKNERIKPIHNEKNNYPDISKNLNHGLEAAMGTYIARLDDDDYWCDDDKLKKQYEFLEANKEYAVTGGGTIVVDENDKERFRYLKPEADEAIRSKALLANPFTHSTVMFRRDMARTVGGYGNFKNAEDWDLWLRMGMRGKFYNFQDYFVRYLMNEQSKTFVFKRSQSGEIVKLISAYKRSYPHYYAALFVSVSQYCYSLLPVWLRRPLYNFLSKMKRSAFTR